LIGAFCGAAALLVARLPNLQAVGVGLGVALVMLLSIAWLERAPYEKQVRKTT